MTYATTDEPTSTPTTSSPSEFPTYSPTTEVPTLQPTPSPTQVPSTAAPTTAVPTSASPTTTNPTQNPTDEDTTTTTIIDGDEIIADDDSDTETTKESSIAADSTFVATQSTASALNITSDNQTSNYIWVIALFACALAMCLCTGTSHRNMVHFYLSSIWCLICSGFLWFLGWKHKKKILHEPGSVDVDAEGPGQSGTDLKIRFKNANQQHIVQNVDHRRNTTDGGMTGNEGVLAVPIGDTAGYTGNYSDSESLDVIDNKSTAGDPTPNVKQKKKAIDSVEMDEDDCHSKDQNVDDIEMEQTMVNINGNMSDDFVIDENENLVTKGYDAIVVAQDDDDEFEQQYTIDSP